MIWKFSCIFVEIKLESMYYTPELEEFHFGFLYEYKNHNGKWVKHNFGESHIIHNELDEFEDDLMKIVHAITRVKILDQEDIESFNFVRDFSTFSEHLKSGCEVYISEERSLMLGHYPSLNKITIATRDHSKNEMLLKSTWDSKAVNLITIKNKSELEKLLKQIDE